MITEYGFGTTDAIKWIKASSVKKAIRAFRVGVTYPHTYSTGRIPTKVTAPDGGTCVVYLASEENAVIPVFTRGAEGRLQRVAEIPPEGDEADEYRRDALPVGALPSVADSGGGDLVVAGAEAGIGSASRREIEERQLALQQKMGELALLKMELAKQADALRREMERRAQQIWMIELFLGSQEEVHQLAQGAPAHPSEPIHIFQRILCMDEEYAVHQFLHDPDSLRDFDYSYVKDFDGWAVGHPDRLNSIIPCPKGIVGLRVRRHAKDRSGATALEQIQAEHWDQQTYLLVRNGENVYRLWVDANMWPRFFPRESDFLPRDGKRWRTEGDYFHQRETRVRAEQATTKSVVGALIIQGLVERSDLFHPLPHPSINIFDPGHVEHYFRLVRNDGGERVLTDGDPLRSLTWDGYREFLQSQLAHGSRVVFIPTSRFDADEVYARTGVRSVSWSAPPTGELLVAEETEKRGFFHSFSFSVLYLPKGWAGEDRKRRVRFAVSNSEIWPVDAMSWRVMRHLLMDRGQREHYAAFFPVFRAWYGLMREERAMERPFVDLLMREVGAESEHERARLERLLRWWKLKTKEHRAVADDEAKALRMISAAWLRGDDYEDDPERLLFGNNGVGP